MDRTARRHRNWFEFKLKPNIYLIQPDGYVDFNLLKKGALRLRSFKNGSLFGGKGVYGTRQFQE
ncbi:MAG: hypothetical protein R2773_01480 [Flavobacteriaceae bacterium]